MAGTQGGTSVIRESGAVPSLVFWFAVRPRFPTANQAQGVGVESLFLLGVGVEHTHVILNLGALFDPSIGGTSRPYGFEGGVDFDLDLDQSGKWSLTGEVGTVWFLSPDANQLHTTAVTSQSLHLPTPLPDFRTRLLASWDNRESSDNRHNDPE